MARTSLETPIAAPLQLGNDGHTHQRRSKDSDYELPAFVNGQWQGPVAPQASSSHEDIARLQPSDPAYQTLPPADGGKQAWLFLFGCFMMEALVWGERNKTPAHPPLDEEIHSLRALELTLPRLPLQLRRLPRLLQHAPALRRLAFQHRRHRHNQHGTHVLPRARVRDPNPALPRLQTSGHVRWSRGRGTVAGGRQFLQ